MLKEKNHSVERAVSSPCSIIEGAKCFNSVVCAGCRTSIHDRYYLLAVDRQWHASCLKCCECKLPLDTELTCFARDGNIYCKEDYYRTFGVSRCGRCRAGISANELVMRARNLVYHLHCFCCISCGIPLSKGDHFGMRDELIYCRPHYEMLDMCDARDLPTDMLYRGGSESPLATYYSGASPVHHQGKGRPRKRKLLPSEDSSPPCINDLPVSMRIAAATLELLQQNELSSSMESLSYDSSVTSPGSSNGHHTQRTKRMRTSFKHHQLRTMKTYFAINQNPDAKDLKQLAQKTGLSKRVLQVWFQNARAKWRRNMLRQEGNSQLGNGQVLSPCGAGGTNATAICSDGTSLSQSNIDDLRHHMHAPGNGSVISYGELYCG